MIVDSMSTEEVYDAIIKAVEANTASIESVISPKKKVYRRIILKGGDKRHDFKPLRKVVDGITFYVCPYSRSKRDYKKHDIMYVLFAHFFYMGTNWYAMMCNGDCVALYKQHFFERYIERHLKDGSNVSIDTVHHYFIETDYLINCRMIENPKHPNCVYGATNIGVCCGYHLGNNKMAVWSTYVDKETLNRGDKKDLYDESNDRFIPIGTDSQGNRIFKADVMIEICA